MEQQMQEGCLTGVTIPPWMAVNSRGMDHQRNFSWLYHKEADWQMTKVMFLPVGVLGLYQISNTSYTLQRNHCFQDFAGYFLASLMKFCWLLTLCYASLLSCSLLFCLAGYSVGIIQSWLSTCGSHVSNVRLAPFLNTSLYCSSNMTLRHARLFYYRS